MTTRARRQLERLTGGPLTLGALLRAIREGEGWSLAEMGARLGVTRAFVANLEKGKPVSAARAAHYAKVLGYSQSQFVRLALQDELSRAGLAYDVRISQSRARSAERDGCSA